jgi:hypothetical protein
LESSSIWKKRQAKENVAKDGDEIRNTGRSWNEVKWIAKDRNAWKIFMDDPCFTRSKGN